MLDKGVVSARKRACDLALFGAFGFALHRSGIGEDLDWPTNYILFERSICYMNNPSIAE